MAQWVEDNPNDEFAPWAPMAMERTDSYKSYFVLQENALCVYVFVCVCPKS